MSEPYPASISIGPIPAGPLADAVEAAAEGRKDPDSDDHSLVDAVDALSTDANEVSTGRHPETNALIARMDVYDANYGLGGSYFKQAITACREHEIPYFAADDGKYEIPGEYRAWVPGMTDEYTASGKDPLDQIAAIRQLAGADIEPHPYDVVDEAVNAARAQ